MLEKSYGWNGILSEPARNWQEELRRNRSAMISQKCVWSVSGERLSFRQTEDAGFSTLDEFWATDQHAEKRRSGIVYEVETISLNDLLLQNRVPAVVDYLSVDTEGSEYNILSKLDFEKWQVSVLTVEHNFRPEREEIFSLMSGHRYVRAPVSVSKYDDWYVAEDLGPRLAEIFGY